MGEWNYESFQKGEWNYCDILILRIPLSILNYDLTKKGEWNYGNFEKGEWNYGILMKKASGITEKRRVELRKKEISGDCSLEFEYII